MKEIRNRAKQAVAKRIAKRVAKYKKKLCTNLPPQIEKWKAREQRLLQVLSGTAGVPIDALLVRECPDPPVEVDPDTDEEETKKADVDDKTLPITSHDNDPTTQPWTSEHTGHSHACHHTHTHTHITHTAHQVLQAR